VFYKVGFRSILAALTLIMVLLMLSMRVASAQTATRTAQTGSLEADSVSDSLIGIQYEQWFYGPESWQTAEAIPLLGKYTTDEATVGKHYAQFQDLGIDWLLIDCGSV